MNARLKGLLGSALAAAIVLAGIGGSAANAAPGDPGTDEWVSANSTSNIWTYAAQNTPADYANWQASFTSSGDSSCISPVNSLVIDGFDNYPYPNDPESRPVFSVSSSYSSVLAYSAASGSFSADFASYPCASAWGLDGTWYLTQTGALFPSGGGTEIRDNQDVIASGSDGVIVTPTNWLATSSGVATGGNARLFLGRTDGSFVDAIFNGTIQIPSILPDPATFVVNLGDSISIDLAALLDGYPCTMSDGSVCNPDGVTFGSIPTGATGDVNGPIDWTPTAGGDYHFTYSLSDSVTGATSEFVTGTILVINEADLPPPAPISHTWNVVVGNTLMLKAADFLEGCTFGVSDCASFDVILKSLPVGGTSDVDVAADTAMSTFTFTATEAGTFPVTFVVRGKDVGTSAVTTSYVVVTEPRKPVVTG